MQESVQESVYLWSHSRVHRGYLIVPVRSGDRLTAALFDGFGAEISPPPTQARDIAHALALGRQRADQDLAIALPGSSPELLKIYQQMGAIA